MFIEKLAEVSSTATITTTDNVVTCNYASTHVCRDPSTEGGN